MYIYIGTSHRIGEESHLCTIIVNRWTSRSVGLLRETRLVDFKSNFGRSLQRGTTLRGYLPRRNGPCVFLCRAVSVSRVTIVESRRGLLRDSARFLYFLYDISTRCISQK